MDNAQPQSGALNVAVLFLVHPLESVKNIGDVLLLYPQSGVLHGIPDPHPVDRLALTPDSEGDRALAGVFHRVVQQINQNLLDAHLVSAEHTGNGRIDLKFKLKALLLGLDPHHIDDFRKKRAGLVGDIDDFHFSGFDFGDIQNIVYQGQQQLAGTLNIPCVLRHLLRGALPQDDLIQADDGVDGGADLVAHAGEKVVFRLVQLFNFLFLLLREGVFFLIHPVQEQKQHTVQKAHHHHGECGIKKGVPLGIPGDKLGEIEGQAITQQRLRRAEPEKHSHPPSLQGDTDVDEAEHKPLRHSAVESARREKADGKYQQQQDRDGRGSRMNLFLLNAHLNDYVHGGKAGRQKQDIPNASAHRQNEHQCHHTGACYNAKHAFAQADPVIGNDVKPFFNHAVSHPSKFGISERTRLYPGDVRAELLIRTQQGGVMGVDKVRVVPLPRQLQLLRLGGEGLRADG